METTALYHTLLNTVPGQQQAVPIISKSGPTKFHLVEEETLARAPAFEVPPDLVLTLKAVRISPPEQGEEC